MNFMSGLRLELMYISIIVNITASLTHLHDVQLLFLLSQPKEITFFVFTKIINLQTGFRQASNCYKRVFETAKLAYANKTK